MASLAKALDSGAPRQVNPWVKFAFVRLVSLAGILLVLLFATFMVLHLLPGDPARRIAGSEAPAEYVEQLRRELGLNDPILMQFAAYVRKVVRLDFGTSFVSREPVTKVIADRLPKTALLAASAVLLMAVLAAPIGIVAGALTREGRHPRFELIFTSITSVGGALPEYLIGTLLVFVFAVWQRWLPVAGSSGWQSLILPSLAVALRPIMTLSRIVRVETLNVLAQDYMRTARSKHLPARMIYFRHTLRNVLTAVLTITGMYFAELIGGTVIVENVFAWPGLGTSIVTAVSAQDYPVIQEIALLLGMAVVVVNAGVDIVLGIVDPRSLLKV
jgi:peptide/nickel transport system permease protein